MITIRNMSGDIIKEIDADSLQHVNLKNECLAYANLESADLTHANLLNAILQHANLKNANLQNANLKSADLTNSNLEGVNLKNANLRFIIGDGKNIITIRDYWPIVIAPKWNVLAIGNEQHPISDWMKFSNREIHAMSKILLSSWKKRKPEIKRIIEENISK